MNKQIKFLSKMIVEKLKQKHKLEKEIRLLTQEINRLELPFSDKKDAVNTDYY